ncbi:MAG: hypothetical protein M3336_13255 [Chloroflexota bacterium]|nr:hypothetical protein [Chloroflexota bacterium]
MRSTRLGALIWGAVIGLFVVSTVTAYLAGFPTARERQQLASSLQSFTILLGVPRNADTVAGFTTWRVLLPATIIGAIWGMLTSTSRLRGEEDAGRWELLLASALTKRAATVQVLIGLGGALGIMFSVCALLTILAGRLPGAHFPATGSLLFAAGLCSGAAMFLAVGALTSQLSATRGQALRLSAAVLGLGYAVRMIADSRPSLGWLRWLSPLGWLEELHPLRNPQVLALAPVALLIASCCALAVLLAGRRDLNASLIPEGRVRGHDTRWPVGTVQLAARLTRTAGLGWLLGAVAMAFTMGAVARSAASILSASPAFAAALGRLGIRSATEGYLGLAFLLLAVVLGVLAASQLAAIREEETSGRVENLLARPISRTSWLGQRLLVSMALVVGVGLAFGIACWLGARSQHLGIALPSLLAAGLNATAPAVLILGAGALVFALRGSLAAPVAYAMVAWSFLVQLLGSFLKSFDWVRDTSLFNHIALAPSEAPDWAAWGFLAALGAGLAALGAVGLVSRDVDYA